MIKLTPLSFLPMQPQIVYKTPDESITYTIDVTDLTSYKVTNIIGSSIRDFHSELDVPDLNIEDITISDTGAAIHFRLSGGIKNNLYIVQIQFRLENGDILEATFYVFVEELL